MAASLISPSYSIFGNINFIKRQEKEQTHLPTTQVTAQNYGLPRLPDTEIGSDRAQQEDEFPAPAFDTSNDFVLPDTPWDFEVVEDWEARIASYTAEQKRTYRFLIQKTMELKDVLANREGWDILANDKKNNVLIECKK